MIHKTITLIISIGRPLLYIQYIENTITLIVNIYHQHLMIYTLYKTQRARTRNIKRETFNIAQNIKKRVIMANTLCNVEDLASTRKPKKKTLQVRIVCL